MKKMVIRSFTNIKNVPKNSKLILKENQIKKEVRNYSFGFDKLKDFFSSYGKLEKSEVKNYNNLDSESYGIPLMQRDTEISSNAEEIIRDYNMDSVEGLVVDCIKENLETKFNMSLDDSLDALGMHVVDLDKDYKERINDEY